MRTNCKYWIRIADTWYGYCSHDDRDGDECILNYEGKECAFREDEDPDPIFARIGRVQSEIIPGKEADREEILKASDMLYTMVELHYGELDTDPNDEEGLTAAKAILTIAYSDDEKKLSEEIAGLEKAHAVSLLHPEERLKTTAQLEAENPGSLIAGERQIALVTFMNALDAKIDEYFS